MKPTAWTEGELTDQFDYLIDGARNIIEQSESKGYGPDMYASCGAEHAFGEMIAKVYRYRARGNVEDLFKVVSWIVVYLAGETRRRGSVSAAEWEARFNDMVEWNQELYDANKELESKVPCRDWTTGQFVSKNARIPSPEEINPPYIG